MVARRESDIQFEGEKVTRIDSDLRSSRWIEVGWRESFDLQSVRATLGLKEEKPQVFEKSNDFLCEMISFSRNI